MIVSGEPDAPIHTQRLRLRLPQPDDAPALAALMAPAVSARLASWPASLAPEIAAQRLTEARGAAMDGRALPLVIESRADKVLIGWIGATRAEQDPSRAILTYWLGCDHHGQGYMREAAPAAMAAIFDRLGVAEIRAAVQCDNDASRAVLRGLGMGRLGLGHIWCSARGREEACEWWGVARPMAAPVPMEVPALITQVPVTAPLQAATP
jgi:RimJ/RimL family protein N-acetyltransferase